MKTSASVARNNLAKLTRKLTIALRRLQKNNIKNKNLKEIIQVTQQIKAISAELAALQTLTLLKEEYVALCDLIICGSTMADYLIRIASVNKIMRKHALYWQNLIQKFKPLLKSVYYLDSSQQP